MGALFAGALAAPALAEDGVTDTEIILGSHTALSGPVAAWGVGATEGARMRYDEANEKGGVHGRKIKLIVEDHGYQVPRAVQAANKLINNDKIFAMVGALGTPRTTRCSASSSPKGVPNIFPFTAARSMVEPHHPLKFAQFSSYYDQVRAATKYFVEKEGKKKLCTMYQDTDFGHEVRDGVRDQAKALKIEIAAEATFGPTDTEFTGQIGKLKVGGLRPGDHGLDHQGQHPGCRHGPEARLDRRDLRGPGGLLRSDRGRRAGRHQGGLLLRHRHALRLSRHQRRGDQGWSAKYKARTGQDANSAAQYGYVGSDIIVKALEAAGKDLTRAKFLAALEVHQGLQADVPRPDPQLRPQPAPGLARHVPGQGGRRPLEGGGGEPDVLIRRLRRRPKARVTQDPFSPLAGRGTRDRADLNGLRGRIGTLNERPGCGRARVKCHHSLA